MTQPTNDIAADAVDRLIGAGLLDPARRNEARTLITQAVAPMAAAAIRATAVGYSDIYTDAHEYGEQVDEITRAVDQLARCLPDDSELVFEGAARLIDDGGANLVLIEALEVTTRRPSPRQAADLVRLLRIDSEDARDALVSSLQCIAQDADEPALQRTDLTPLLEADDRAVREAALLVLSRLPAGTDRNG